MNYPRVILAVHLEELQKKQKKSDNYHEIEELQDKIEQTTAAIELIIQHQQ